VDWFHTLALPQYDGWPLFKPVEALRVFEGMQFEKSVGQMGQYLLEYLPSLEHCVLGATPGGIGETCAVILILVGVFFMYRGYVPWKLPVAFLGSAYLAAMFLPIMVKQPQASSNIILMPFLAGGPAVGLTYVHYQIFSGGLILGAMILAGDMTSRPIALRGQVIFAAGAGVLTIVFRLYTHMAIPCYAAILVLNSLTSTINRFTRPRGQRSWIREA
jgi:H+/Na+-translocating ferredoxin:NAD+ oxidoreductase subunit D